MLMSYRFFQKRYLALLLFASMWFWSCGVKSDIKDNDNSSELSALQGSQYALQLKSVVAKSESGDQQDLQLHTFMVCTVKDGVTTKTCKNAFYSHGEPVNFSYLRGMDVLTESLDDYSENERRFNNIGNIFSVGTSSVVGMRYAFLKIPKTASFSFTNLHNITQRFEISASRMTLRALGVYKIGAVLLLGSLTAWLTHAVTTTVMRSVGEHNIRHNKLTDNYKKERELFEVLKHSELIASSAESYSRIIDKEKVHSSKEAIGDVVRKLGRHLVLMAQTNQAAAYHSQFPVITHYCLPEKTEQATETDSKCSYFLKI